MAKSEDIGYQANSVFCCEGSVIFLQFVNQIVPIVICIEDSEVTILASIEFNPRDTGIQGDLG